MSASDDASSVPAGRPARAAHDAARGAADDHDLAAGVDGGPATESVAPATPSVASDPLGSTTPDTRRSAAEIDGHDTRVDEETEATDYVRGTAELRASVSVLIGRLIDAATSSPGGARAAYEELSELRDDLRRRTTACGLDRESLARSAREVWRVLVSPGLIGVGGPPPLAVWASVAETRGWVALTGWWPQDRAPRRDGVQTLEAAVARVLGVPADRVYMAVLADLDGKARAALARAAVRIDPPLGELARPETRRLVVTPIDLEFASDADLIHWVSPHDNLDASQIATEDGI